jgi:hypothetical protein
MKHCVSTYLLSVSGPSKCQSNNIEKKIPWKRPISPITKSEVGQYFKHRTVKVQNAKCIYCVSVSAHQVSGRPDRRT